jgi:hypothetical protein
VVVVGADEFVDTLVDVGARDALCECPLLQPTTSATQHIATVARFSARSDRVMTLGYERAAEIDARPLVAPTLNELAIG